MNDIRQRLIRDGVEKRVGSMDIVLKEGHVLKLVTGEKFGYVVDLRANNPHARIPKGRRQLRVEVENYDPASGTLKVVDSRVGVNITLTDRHVFDYRLTSGL